MEAPLKREEVFRRLRRQFEPTVVRASGLEYKDVIGFDAFLVAFFKDYDADAMNGQMVEAFKVFVVTWKWKGGPSKKVEVKIGEKDEDVQEAEVPAVPDFTYNPEFKKSVYDLQLPYGTWLSALADYKLNLSGPSRPMTAQQEQMRWGGPVDASRDVKLPDITKRSPLDRLLG